MLRSALLALVILSATVGSLVAAPDEARLLRFPAIHGDQIVFTYAGDLYTVPAGGGTARRLTTHAGFEMFPRFSPDGTQVAFTGQYDGNTEVYVVPADGGEPKRLTYTATLGRDDVSDRMGPNNIVMGWTPDGKNILFRSRMRSFNDFIGQLYTVPVEGGLPKQLPLPRGGFASYSPDGKQLVYNRIFREFRTWKRYRGGMADDVWLYDFATKKTEQLTDDPAQDIIPMFVGEKIYFLSDRGKEQRFNLYSVDPATKKVEQHTDFTEFDIKFPSAGDDAIVFENGGYIYRFDAEDREGREGDRPDSRRPARRPRRADRREQERHGVRDLARRQAGAVRRPRRRVHRARPSDGVDAQPDQHARRPRTQPEVVARRQERGVRLRRHRRGRDSRRPGRRQRAREAGHERRRTPTSTNSPGRPTRKKILWARQEAPAPVRGRGDEEGHAGEPGEGVGDPRVRLVAGLEVDRVRPAGSGHAPQGSPVLARIRQDDRGDRRLVRVRLARVQRRRQVPVLRLGPRLQPDLQPDGVEPRLPRHVARLLRHAGEGHAEPVRGRNSTTNAETEEEKETTRRTSPNAST